MKKDDMIMKMGIVHILDSVVGMPVLSDCPIDMGSNLCDFLKAHIEKFTESDDMKVCQFSDESEVMGLIQNCNAENFVQTSRALCEKLYGIMNSNIDIPAADVAVVVFSAEGVDYFGFLKLNYKTSYTHATKATETGENLNDIILQKAILPSAGQKLSEAFLVNLSNGEILLTEKKFEVNGEKKLYFSELFLECHAPMSQKTKLDIVTKAVEDAFRYGKLVLATITYNGDIFPFMRTYIENLTERSYQNRTIGLIENGSWAPAAARIMQGMFEKSKNITWLENNVKITSSLSEANEAEIEAMAEELCK